jgi:hypothetical protein
MAIGLGGSLQDRRAGRLEPDEPVSHSNRETSFRSHGNPETPHFIDANPRMVEPMNGWLSGVDLPGALLQASLGETPPVQPDGRAGVLTRLGLMGLLDAARRRHRRRDILREIGLLAAGSGRYRGSREELVPLLSGPWCAVPLSVVVARLLRAPEAAARLSQTIVAAYSLTPPAIRRLHTWQTP